MKDRKRFKLKNNKLINIFPISDVHYGSPQCNQEYFEYMLDKFDKTQGYKIIYLLGDLMDCATKRLGNSAYRQVYTVEEQLDYIIKQLKPFKQHIRGCVKGNHECFDEETELLTSNGWVKYDDINENILVGTFNKDTKELEYQKPTKINIEYVEEELIHLKSRSIDILTTKNHRFYYTNRSDEKTLNRMRMEEIQNIHQKEIVLRQGCANNNEEYPISDDEIKLIAWCLTDSHYSYNRVIFYQRKSEVDRIINILSSLSIPYNYKERDRDIKEICGRKLKNKPQIGCEVKISREYVENLCNSHTVIPEFVSKFSKRQFMIFLDELIFCDGSKHKNSPNNSWVLYKSKEFLDEVQILCIKNDIRTSLSEYRKGHYRLNINPLYNRSSIRNNQEIVDYKGIIWCVTVPNDTLIVRRNGKVVITGNSRHQKEFDLDITKILADSLGIKYDMNEIYDTFCINGEPYTIWGTHGTRTSQQQHLMMGNVERQTSHINANLYLYGHCHYLNNWSQVIRDKNEYHRRYYLLTGHYLNYANSYAEEKLLKPSLPCFAKVTINKNLRTNVEQYHLDEIDERYLE